MSTNPKQKWRYSQTTIYNIHKRAACAPIPKTQRRHTQSFPRDIFYRRQVRVFQSQGGSRRDFHSSTHDVFPYDWFPLRGATRFGRTGRGAFWINRWRRFSHPRRFRGRRETRCRRRGAHRPRAGAAPIFQSQQGFRRFRGIRRSRGFRLLSLPILRIQRGREHNHVLGGNPIPPRWNVPKLVKMPLRPVIASGHGAI